MTNAKSYRKKPVVVEAMQLIDDLGNHMLVARWIASGGGSVRMPAAEPCLYIETLEGEMRASIGDFVIRGVQGEFYPCKPDVFGATYEEEPASAPEAEPKDCPHAAPFRYCDGCQASPCPIGLDK